jgi:hypothetical protein
MVNLRPPGRFVRLTGRQWALVVVALFELFLFCGYHRERYKVLQRLDRPGVERGEGLVIRCDGLGYYAWLRSLLVDQDWSFADEFDEHNPIGDFVPSERTPSGRRANPWSVGPGCAWALAVVPVHFVLAAAQSSDSRLAADGYSLPYQLTVGVTTLVISWLGLFFLYRICRYFASPRKAALAAGLMTLGTTVVYYTAIEPSMAHGIGTAATAAFVCFWTSTYGQVRPGRWLVVGCLLGLTALVRWQLITLAVVPAGEAVLSLRQEKAASRALLLLVQRFFLTCVGWFIAFLPQLVAWRLVYGEWFANPIPVSHNWLDPAWRQILFSQDRSLFYWTPLSLVALLGYSWCGRAAARRCRPPSRSQSPFGNAVSRNSVSSRGAKQSFANRGSGMGFGSHGKIDERLLLLVAALGVQIYLLAVMWGPGVHGGAAYGMRHLTEAVVLLAPGLAAWLQITSRPTCRLICLVGCLLVAWNLLLVSEYRYALLPANSGADPGTLLANIALLAERKGWLLIGQVFLAPALLYLLLCREKKGNKISVEENQPARMLPEVADGQGCGESTEETSQGIGSYSCR